jgi:hypothetical protein
VALEEVVVDRFQVDQEPVVQGIHLLLVLLKEIMVDLVVVMQQTYTNGGGGGGAGGVGVSSSGQSPTPGGVGKKFTHSRIWSSTTTFLSSTNRLFFLAAAVAAVEHIMLELQ